MTCSCPSDDAARPIARRRPHTRRRRIVIVVMREDGMSDQREPAVGADLIGERRHLLSLAFRMLGTVAEAEDAVQETYTRWYRMPEAERDAIEVPRAWLT